jgi:hypothetical protein
MINDARRIVVTEAATAAGSLRCPRAKRPIAGKPVQKLWRAREDEPRGYKNYDILKQPQKVFAV